MRLRPALFLLASLLIPLGVGAQSDRAPSLIVGATDHAGFPLEGVRFLVSAEGLEDTEVETDEHGRAMVELPDEETVAVVTLTDDRYRSDRPEMRSTEDSRLLPVRLFSAKASEMTREERVEFALWYPRTFVAEAERRNAVEEENAEPPEESDLATTAAFRMSAFLAGMRRESPAPFPVPTPESLDFDPEEDEVPEVPVRASVRVIDDRGQGIAGVRVDLYAYDADTATARLVGWERTTGNGTARFTEVVDGTLHRAETRLPDGRVARSTFRMISNGDSRTSFPVMIARAPDGQVSGIVVEEGEPASVLVELLRPDGRPLVSETTDEQGYFSMGPLSGQGDRIRLTAMRENGSQTFELPVETPWREMILPLEVLFAD